MSDEFDFDDLSEIDMIKSLIWKHKNIITYAVIAISVFSVLLYLGVYPHEQYAITGQIIEIYEGGYTIQINKLDSGVPPAMLDSDKLEVTNGICQLDPAFANAHCHVGTDVRVVFYRNAIDREFWYIESIILGEIPNADANQE